MPAIVLTPAQRKEHRALAHHLEPVVMIGGDGLSPAVLREIDWHEPEGLNISMAMDFENHLHALRTLREHARERQDPCGLGQSADDARRPRPIPGGELHRLVCVVVACDRCFDQALEIGDAGRLAEAPFVDACLKPIFERNHQLHPLE